MTVFQSNFGEEPSFEHSDVSTPLRMYETADFEEWVSAMDSKRSLRRPYTGV
jgi:hypothetical protein